MDNEMRDRPVVKCAACWEYGCDGMCPEMEDYEAEQRERERFEDEREAWLEHGHREGFA